MSDPVYEVLKDLVVPGLAGIGAVVFGLGAVLAATRANDVAEQSHNLAGQVRGDELKREADAARERYRDQLFRTVEPSASAFLEHRAELIADARLGTERELVLRSNAIARLRLVAAVTNVDDTKVVLAVIKAYRGSVQTGNARVVRGVTGQLALILPALLTEGHDADALAADASALLQKQIKKAAERAKGKPDAGPSLED